MKKSNKSIITSIFVFFIILLLSISIVMANNANTRWNCQIDEEKIYYEIKYFDSQIIYMASLLNNIEGSSNFYIDWKELQERTEILYSYWNSAILDLNYLNIEKKYLTDFGKELDELSISVRVIDRNGTLTSLIELYNKLIIFSECLSYKNYNDVLFSKYNLLIAYSIVETGNWTLAHEYLLNASKYIFELVNSVEIDEYKQYNINQAYIAVKELENLVNIKDVGVFYIKYKIVIDKLENI